MNNYDYRLRQISIYKYVQEELYYKPYIDYLRNQGYHDFTPKRVGSFKDSRGRFMSFAVSIPYEKLSIAEILYLKGLDVKRIANLLSTNAIAYEDSDIVRYISAERGGRWHTAFKMGGETYSLVALRRFLQDHYLAPEFTVK